MINFNKKTIGIDVSDHTIQVVSLAYEDGKIKVDNFGKEDIASGIVSNGRIKDNLKLSAALKNALGEAEFENFAGREIYALLPESQVYTDISDIPEPEAIADTINKIITNTFPFSIEELAYSHKIIDNPGDAAKRLLIMAVRKKAINEWEAFFKENSLEIKAFDFEALAVFRGLFSSWPEEPVGLLGIGASATNFTIFDNAGLTYAYTLPEAGNFFTREISEEFKISEEKAEELKIKAGLSGETSGVSAATVLRQCLDNLFREIEQNIAYFHKQHNEKLSKLYLYGGSVKLKGLKEYLAKQKFVVGLEIAEPRLGPANLSEEYIGAIGLALRGVEKKWAEIDPCLLPSAANGDKSNFITKIFSVFKNLKKFYKIIIIIILLFGIYFIFLASWMSRQKMPTVDDSPQSSSPRPAAPPNKILEKQPEDQLQVKIKNISSSLNVRSGPGTSYGIIGHANANEIFTLVSEEGDWYQIKLKDNQEGWIFASLSEKIAP